MTIGKVAGVVGGAATVLVEAKFKAMNSFPSTLSRLTVDHSTRNIQHNLSGSNVDPLRRVVASEGPIDRASAQPDAYSIEEQVHGGEVLNFYTL